MTNPLLASLSKLQPQVWDEMFRAEGVRAEYQAPRGGLSKTWPAPK
ncbi:MAG: hypothetical protein WKG07_43595 [Hymenobacter sp.]